MIIGRPTPYMRNVQYCQYSVRIIMVLVYVYGTG